jgi:hypothetical protein
MTTGLTLEQDIDFLHHRVDVLRAAVAEVIASLHLRGPEAFPGQTAEVAIAIEGKLKEADVTLRKLLGITEP